MMRYINPFYSFGTRKNCHWNGENPLLFQFIRKAIERTSIILKELHSCVLHIKFSQKCFYQECIHIQMKIQENINLALGRIDQPSTTYLAFGRYFKRSGNTIWTYISYSKIKLINKSVDYSSQRNHTGLLDFCN